MQRQPAPAPARTSDQVQGQARAQPDLFTLDEQAKRIMERIRETGVVTPRLIHAETNPPGGAFLTYNHRPQEEILALPWRLGRGESVAEGWHGTVHVIKVEDRVGVPVGCMGGLVGDLFLCGDPHLIRDVEYSVSTGQRPLTRTAPACRAPSPGLLPFNLQSGTSGVSPLPPRLLTTKAINGFGLTTSALSV